MRLKATYRAERRNAEAKHKGRALNKDFARLSGPNWKLPFPETKKDPESGLDAPFITVLERKPRGKTYPYGSTKQGYVNGPVVTLSW